MVEAFQAKMSKLQAQAFASEQIAWQADSGAFRFVKETFGKGSSF